MRKDEKGILLILFCAGLIGGMLFPRWLNLPGGAEAEFPDLSFLARFPVLETGRGALLEAVLKKRITVLLLLYFSAYTAAGFWILLGTVLIFGASFGFLCALSVLKLRYWGILFLACGLLPQWVLYVLAGGQIADFAVRRRQRAAACSGNALPSPNRKIFLDFLKLLATACCGVAAEVYVNPWLIGWFCSVYR